MSFFFSFSFFLSRESGLRDRSREEVKAATKLSRSFFFFFSLHLPLSHLGAPPASRRSQRPRQLARPVVFFICRGKDIREEKNSNRCFGVVPIVVWRPEQGETPVPLPASLGRRAPLNGTRARGQESKGAADATNFVEKRCGGRREGAERGEERRSRRKRWGATTPTPTTPTNEMNASVLLLLTYRHGERARVRV